jgi:cytochrome P450
LAFAEPFDCLQKSQNHPWIEYAFDVVRMQSLMRAVDYYPWFKRMLLMMVPSGTVKGFQTHLEYIKAKALHRLNLKSERLDLMAKMAAPDSGLTAEEFIASGDTILLGGSETTATLLSGLTYFLLMNPRALKKLSSEIRARYTSEEEIDFASVNTLEYMLACIDEAFRLYPPVPGAMLRRTREAVKIDGKYVTPNVRNQTLF